MDRHLHAARIENGYYTEDKKCFRGDEALNEAKAWLVNILRQWAPDEEAQPDVAEAYKHGEKEIGGWDGATEFVEVAIREPFLKTTVEYGFAIAHLSDPCEEMVFGD